MSDLIEKQAAITIPVMPKEDREYQTYNLDDAYEQGWEDLQEIIEQLPSADAIPVEWIMKVMDAVNDSNSYEAYEILNWLLDLWRDSRESFM